MHWKRFTILVATTLIASPALALTTNERQKHLEAVTKTLEVQLQSCPNSTPGLHGLICGTSPHKPNAFTQAWDAASSGQNAKRISDWAAQNNQRIANFEMPDGDRYLVVTGPTQTGAMFAAAWPMPASDTLGNAPSMVARPNPFAPGIPILDGSPFAPLGENLGMNFSSAFSRDGQHYITLGGERQTGTWLRVWDVQTGTRRFEAKIGEVSNGSGLALSPDGRYAYLTLGRQALHIWDAQRWQPITEIPLPAGYAADLDAHPTRPEVTVVIGNQALMVNLETQTTTTLTGIWASARYSPDGTRMALGPNAIGGQVQDPLTILALEPAGPRTSLKVPVGVVAEVSWRPDGQSISVVAGTRVTTYDLTGSKRASFDAPYLLVRAATWSADQRVLAVAGIDLSQSETAPIYFLDGQTLKLIAVATTRSAIGPAGASFSPDGRAFGSGTYLIRSAEGVANAVVRLNPSMPLPLTGNNAQ